MVKEVPAAGETMPATPAAHIFKIGLDHVSAEVSERLPESTREDIYKMARALSRDTSPSSKSCPSTPPTNTVFPS
jgi:hypothetical protein